MLPSWLLVAVLAIGGARGFRFWGFDSNCAWSRQDAVECMRRHVDTDRDDAISIAELDAARNKFEGAVLKTLEWFVGWGIDTSTKKVLEDCGGYPHNRTWTERELRALRLTIKQFLRNKKTCLPTQISLCMLKFVCDRADAAEPPPITLAPRVVRGPQLLRDMARGRPTPTH